MSMKTVTQSSNNPLVINLIANLIDTFDDKKVNTQPTDVPEIDDSIQQKPKKLQQQRDDEDDELKAEREKILKLVIPNTPHGSNMTIASLIKLNFWNKRRCMISPLSLDNQTTVQQLKPREWIRQFGTVKDIRRTKKNKVSVTFDNEIAALNLISHCKNNKVEYKDKILRARYMTTNYCEYFLSNMQCELCDDNCKLKKIHSLKTQEDVLKKKDMQNFMENNNENKNKNKSQKKLEPQHKVCINNQNSNMILHEWIFVDPLLSELKNASVGKCFRYDFEIQNTIGYTIELYPNGKSNSYKSQRGFIGIMCYPCHEIRTMTKKKAGGRKFKLVIEWTLSIICNRMKLCNRTKTSENGTIAFLKAMKLSQIANCDSLKITMEMNIIETNLFDNQKPQQQQLKRQNETHAREMCLLKKQLEISNEQCLTLQQQVEQLRAQCDIYKNEMIKYKKQMKQRPDLIKHKLKDYNYDLNSNKQMTQQITNSNNMLLKYKLQSDLCAHKFEYWLCDIVGLKQYLPIFKQNEWNDISMVEYINEYVITNELGLGNKNHIKLLLTRIEEFKYIRQEFHKTVNMNAILKQFQQNFVRNGILTINDLKEDVKTKTDVKRICKTNDKLEIQQILDAIHSEI